MSSDFENYKTLREKYEDMKKGEEYNATKIYDELEKMSDELLYKHAEELAKLYIESKKEFESFYSKDSFLPDDLSKRRNPDDDKIITYLINKKNIMISNDESLNFNYIEREISPNRITNSGQRQSGTGGIDFIGWNIKKECTIIGEIKKISDKDPYYALIQLLTYSSEMFTSNQIKRINETGLFKIGSEIKTINSKSKPYLYILFFDFHWKSENMNRISKKILILKKCMHIAKDLLKILKDEFEDIVFLSAVTENDDNKKINIEKIMPDSLLFSDIKN